MGQSSKLLFCLEIRKIALLDDRQMANIKFWLEKDHLTDSDELPQVAQTFRRIFKPNDYNLGVMYRVGEFVVQKILVFRGVPFPIIA